MNVKIIPSSLSGKINAIPSKSDAHRLLICASLSKEETKITLPSSSDDIDATINCLKALGTEISRFGDVVSVKGGSYKSSASLDAKESGSTLRFLMPLASFLSDEVSFTGQGRLPERPITHLTQTMKEHGVLFSGEKLPFTMTGKLKNGVFTLPGDISSQYITGLLFALPLLEGDSEIRLTSRLQSSAYIDITLSALKKFGVNVERRENSFFVRGNQKYTSPKEVRVEGDWSNSSFFLVAGAIGEKIEMSSLDPLSKQGDKEILRILKAFGAKVSVSENIEVSRDELSSREIDLREIPDLLPILSVLASFSKGATRFKGGERLRIKESDRLKTTASMINALGGIAREFDDGIEVVGTSLKGGVVDGAGDHRIVMAAAVAGAFCEGETTILGAEAHNKSYPLFLEDFKKLGGKYYVI